MCVLCAQARRPFHHPVIFARAQHVHHIIRQESIFNISEHHNPRAGHRGRLREEDLPVTWLSTREGQAARDWGTESQTATNKSAGKTEKKNALIWSGTHVSLGSTSMQTHANECTVPSLRHRRKWYLTGMMIPFLADKITSWWMRDKSNSSAGKHENTHSRAYTI